MNITLSEVVFIDERKQMHPFDNFMVKARLIKFIHIPQEVIHKFLDKLIRHSFVLCAGHLRAPTIVDHTKPKTKTNMLIGTQPYQKHTLHTHTFSEQKIRMPYRMCVTNVTSARVCVCIVCVCSTRVYSWLRPLRRMAKNMCLLVSKQASIQSHITSGLHMYFSHKSHASFIVLIL